MLWHKHWLKAALLTWRPWQPRSQGRLPQPSRGGMTAPEEAGIEPSSIHNRKPADASSSRNICRSTCRQVPPHPCYGGPRERQQRRVRHAQEARTCACSGRRCSRFRGGSRGSKGTAAAVLFPKLARRRSMLLLRCVRCTHSRRHS